MQELIQNPAVQGGALPFAMALAWAAALRNTRYLGLAIGAGFLCTVALTMGFSLEPLTVLRKLVMAGIAAVIICSVFMLNTHQPKAIHYTLLGLAGSIVTLWVLQRILEQQEGSKLVLGIVSSCAFILVMLVSSQRCVSHELDKSVTTLVLSLAIGALALLGASAQLALLGISLSASLGAVLSIQILSKTSQDSNTLTLPTQFISALIGLLAVWAGSLSWYCLLPLPMIAWLGSKAPAREPNQSKWKKALTSFLVALMPAILAISLAWFTPVSS